MKRTKTIFHSSIGTLIEYEEIDLKMIPLTKPIYYMAKLYVYTYMYTHKHIYAYKIMEKKMLFGRKK